MGLSFASSATQNSQNEKLKMEKLNFGDYPSDYGIQIKYLKTYLHILRCGNKCNSVFEQIKLNLSAYRGFYSKDF
ncbi:hypothetical protein CK516_04320 [Nostoc sp. 'Peltigera malacea cyanobiont' DB3992]|nr:hypothetical protein CK516_04320 [Nostoc sp. 'Peltigera malacea cyanobiont' DB3992]